MKRYYDVTLKEKNRNGTASYCADSFSIDKYGILRIQSEECGDITVRISPNEEVIIKSIDVKEEWDEVEE